MTTDPHMQPLSGSTLAEAVPLPRPAGKAKLSSAVAKQTRERLVLLSMGLVTAAAAATCYVLLEYSMASSVLAGGGIWAALMTLHLQMKKTAEIARLKAELNKIEAARGGSAVDGILAAHDALPSEAEGASPRTGLSRRITGVKQAGAQSPAEGGARRSRGMDTQPTPAPDMPSSAGPSGLETQPRWEAQTSASRSGGRPAPGAAVPQRAAGNSSRPHTPAPVVETALWPGTSLSAADPMRDQWAFRPREATDVNDVERDGGDDTTIAPPTPSSSIDADLEMVQRKIKALADEVNAAEMMRDRQPAGSGPSPATAAQLEKSIGALKATADTMRGPASSAAQSQRFDQSSPNAAASPLPLPQGQALPFDLLIPETAERIAVSEPSRTPRTSRAPQQANARPAEPQQPAPELPPLPVLEFVSAPPPNPRVAAIVAAVENGEMDVFLSPIVALQSHQVSHYDVTVRLKSATGAYLDNAEQELQLAGSDVLALFDTARLKRAAILAQRLDARNKSGSLLSAVNGPSITNAEFLETFARVFEERDRISNQLVLTFSQADLEQFSPSAWQALSDMQAFGFRFALSKIDHVDMDFAALAKRGFAFLRLEASALTHGLPARDRFIEADELCKLLAGAGMTLVADTIDDEAVRARVFGFGVLFGQGRLFGGARQVKLDPLPRDASAAA